MCPLRRVFASEEIDVQQKVGEAREDPIFLLHGMEYLPTVLQENNVSHIFYLFIFFCFRFHNHFALLNTEKPATDNNLNSLIVGRSSNHLTVPTVSRRASVEINVNESPNTTKLTNTQDNCFLKPDVNPIRRKSFSAIESSHEKIPLTPTTEKRPFRPLKSRVAIIKDIPSIRDIPAIIHTPPPFPDDFSDTDSRNSDNTESNMLQKLSSTASVNSISDIKIKVKSYERRKSAPCRPKSAPQQPRGSLLTPSASLSRLFDARVDNFRSAGGWKQLVWQAGKWESKYMMKTITMISLWLSFTISRAFECPQLPTSHEDWS